MNRKVSGLISCLLFFASSWLISCNNGKNEPPDSVIATTTEDLKVKTEDVIRDEIDFALRNSGKLDDTVALINAPIVSEIYDHNGYAGLWTSEGKWLPAGDSLMSFIENSKLFGLFPSDYHYSSLYGIRSRLESGSATKQTKMDAVLWSKTELMLTDAFVRIISDIKLGRLPADSVSGRKDSIILPERFIAFVDTLRSSITITQLVQSLEPVHTGYHKLKEHLRSFLDNSSNQEFTLVPLPTMKDPAFRQLLQRRLFEGGYLQSESVVADSQQLVGAVRKFQKENGLTVDGVVGSGTVRMLNLTDREKFIRIAITIDRYKLLPEKMPFRYIWVNIPSFKMELREADSVKLFSKIIVGKAQTRTPLLTSAISELITYPQWTMPNSIIVKEVLPAAKKDPGYFERKGYSLIDSKGEVVDPYTVDWAKYKKGIPYKVVQGSGDDNALGVLKFNFNNKYAVYLHDTNQRYLFARDFRSLSHGCVRVQEWEELAYTIIRYDNATNPKTSPMEDSLGSWLRQKVKRSIPIRNRVPVYIRYFTCEATDAGISFYDDIYGEDMELREKYFAGK